MHRVVELGAWDRQTDRRTDGRIAALLNVSCRERERNNNPRWEIPPWPVWFGELYREREFISPRASSILQNQMFNDSGRLRGKQNLPIMAGRL